MYISVDTPGLTRLSRDLRRAGSEGRVVQRELQRSLRGHLRPLVPEVRSAIRRTPSRGRDRTARSVAARPYGLRDAEARGVQIKVNLAGRNAGVGIRIDPKYFPPGSKTVPWYREGVEGPWRVRNWGRNDRHVQRSYAAFYPTIRPRIEGIRVAVTRDVEAAVDRATGAGLL